jgi:16S rRNA (adenine1518-N6/adenine1519-N6)-dimethyltransferase
LKYHRPRKRFGQNFLRDPKVIAEVVKKLGISTDNQIVEIGPGRGEMTTLLIKRAKNVWAVEIDRDLIEKLNFRFKGTKSLTILEADALKYDFGEIAVQSGGKIRAVGNLPYNISTQLLFNLLPKKDVFSDLTFMLQKEVAERTVSGPGTKSYGAISLLTHLYSDAKILMEIGPEAFWPKPKVRSSLVRYKLLGQPRVPGDKIELFISLVKAAFHHRRKTLINSVMTDGTLGLSHKAFSQACQDCEIEEKRRGETLNFEEFVRLTEALMS